MSRRVLAAVALGAAALGAVPAAPASAKPCELPCFIENLVKCNEITIEGQKYQVCWPL